MHSGALRVGYLFALEVYSGIRHFSLMVMVHIAQDCPLLWPLFLQDGLGLSGKYLVAVLSRLFEVGLSPKSTNPISPWWKHHWYYPKAFLFSHFHPCANASSSYSPFRMLAHTQVAHLCKALFVFLPFCWHDKTLTVRHRASITAPRSPLPESLPYQSLLFAFHDLDLSPKKSLAQWQSLNSTSHRFITIFNRFFSVRSIWAFGESCTRCQRSQVLKKVFFLFKAQNFFLVQESISEL